MFSKGKIQANTEFGPLQGKILTTAETPDIKSFSRLKVSGDIIFRLLSCEIITLYININLF